jgi:hypothetical protein
MSYLPSFVKLFFRGMPIAFRNRHQLIFCWLVILQAVSPGRRTLAELSRATPSYVTEWRFRRFLKAGYWSVHLLIDWFAAEVIKSLPLPEDATVYLIGDGSHKDKRGKKSPLVQKGRKSKGDPWFFGIRFVVLMVSWDVYRVPMGFRIIRRRDDPRYRTENALFREMVGAFAPPPWAKRVIVCGDAAYGSKDNMKMIRLRDKADAKRRWGFVFAIARTWNIEERGKVKKIKDLVTHLPRKLYRRTWIPKLAEESRRKTFWIYSKRLCLKAAGDVTVVLSKKGRNFGPKRTKILVTNLLELTPRQILCVYQRRWSIEILFKELKSGLGLGEHQVTSEEDRVEKSIGISFIAYLFLLRGCAGEIRLGQSWSIFQLQNGLRLRLIMNQVQHDTELRVEKLRKAA